MGHEWVAHIGPNCVIVGRCGHWPGMGSPQGQHMSHKRANWAWAWNGQPMWASLVLYVGYVGMGLEWASHIGPICVIRGLTGHGPGVGSP